MKRKKVVFSMLLSVRIWLLAGLLLAGSFVYGQEIIERDSLFQKELRTEVPRDLVDEEEVLLPDSTVQEAYLVADSVFSNDNTVTPFERRKTFKPNSTKAVLYSAIFPGLGQIYNQKYWKLPIIYGGYMAFMYAITWNNRMYKDYYNAYIDIVHDYNNNLDNPSAWHSSWKDLVRSGDYESFLNNTSNQDLLKRRKDYYRRYRDLSIILTVGFYAICMIDAYVDAELFDFDISPDLSMRIEPMIMPRTSMNNWSFGINYCITF
ncbi:MAG: DUF5683 domain-containing protein [Tannerellaceae bacterium]|nr:DUF5683 domain-containing protein [Tannerellaceae bacterium]